MSKSYADGRNLSFTVEVEIHPRDVALLVLASQGKSQGESADLLGVHRQTVVTTINRLYAKLGVAKQGAAIGAALSRGAMRPDDLALSTDTLTAFWHAGEDWQAIDTKAPASTPKKKAPATPKKKAPRRSGPVTTRKATGPEAEAMKADAAAARAAAVKAAGV